MPDSGRKGTDLTSRDAGDMILSLDKEVPLPTGNYRKDEDSSLHHSVIVNINLQKYMVPMMLHY